MSTWASSVIDFGLSTQPTSHCARGLFSLESVMYHDPEHSFDRWMLAILIVINIIAWSWA